MKFKLIEKSNRRLPKFCGIHLAKSGLISIYTEALNKTGFKEGDRIGMIQSIDSPDDFYLIKIDHEQLPRLRSNKSKKHLEVSYKDAYDMIISHFNLPNKGYKIQIGGAIRTNEYGTAWLLITGPLKRTVIKEVPNA